MWNISLPAIQASLPSLQKNETDDNFNSQVLKCLIPSIYIFVFYVEKMILLGNEWKNQSISSVWKFFQINKEIFRVSRDFRKFEKFGMLEVWKYGRKDQLSDADNDRKLIRLFFEGRCLHYNFFGIFDFTTTSKMI